MGVMKRWATAKMFGQDAVNLALYGPTRKPKPVEKKPETPKVKKVKGQKELPLESENYDSSQCS